MREGNEGHDCLKEIDAGHYRCTIEASNTDELSVYKTRREARTCSGVCEMICSTSSQDINLRTW